MDVLRQVRRLKGRLGPLWWHSFLMFLVSRAGDLISVYIGLFIVPDVLSGEDLGAVLPLTNLIPFIALPLNVVMLAGLKYMAVFQAAGEEGKVSALVRGLLTVTGVVSAILLAGLLPVQSRIHQALRIGESSVVVLVGVSAVLSCWLPLTMVVCQGTKRFYRITFTRLVGPLARLVAVLVLLRPFRLAGYVGSLAAATAAQIALLAPALRPYLHRSGPLASYRDSVPGMVRFGLTGGLFSLLLTWQGFVEPWVIRHALTAVESAGYYVAAMFGNIPLWVAPAMSPFLFPLVSERHERGETTLLMHRQSLAVVVAIGLAIVLALAVSAPRLFDLRPAWAAYREYAPLAWILALVATLTVTLSTHGVLEMACRRFWFLFYMGPLMVLETGSLFLFRNPSGPLLTWVRRAAAVIGMPDHPRLSALVLVVVACRLFAMLGLGCDLLCRSRSESRGSEGVA